MILNLLILIAAGAASGAAVFFMTRPSDGLDGESTSALLAKAHQSAEEIRAEAKAAVERLQRSLESEEQSVQESIQKAEAALAQKEEILKRRQERNNGAQQTVAAIKEEVEFLKLEQDELRQKQIDLLGKQAKLTREAAMEEARENLQKLVLGNADMRKSAMIDEFTEDAPRHAKAILQVVIQRLGVASSVDRNSTSITIKDDKFKGLLIGKNGVNVMYLESLLPISLIFNLGAPDNLHVGGVNLFRRNIAKRAIEKLQTRSKKTGNIDQAMIKAAVDEADAEVMAICDKKGLESIRLVGLDPSKVDKEMINYVGRLYFRTSYGQNVTGHSNEMAFAARMLAEMIGLKDPMVALQGAFFHDIGKAIDHDVGGAHDDLSKEILERFHYDPVIVHAAFAHHDKVPCESPEDFLVKAVDAISGGRPGARQESVTNYFERIQKLEDAAFSFQGVQKVFAMSAGRELRVMVDTNRLHDGDMLELATGIADKIEEEVAFPGVIKVNLIRLTKSVDYAREKLTKR